MCTMTPPAEVRLPTTTRAPGEARTFLRAAACTHHNARVMDEAELLVSELTTNAVLHGAPPVTVRVECDGSAGMRVSVSDHGPERPLERDAADEEESGRGVRLIDLISDRWGTDEQPGNGKAVWFRLRP